MVGHILRHWPVAVLATRGGQGIDAVPAVFHYDGAHTLYIPQDGKPKRPGRLQRFNNIAADPGCTVLLQQYNGDWSRLWWLRLRAQGAEIPLADDVRAALCEKYPQYATTALGTTALSVRILNTRLWSAGRLDAADIGNAARVPGSL